ncbi:MAG: hypothetical protein AAFX50_06600 [Acidobacteriota bacterium]
MQHTVPPMDDPDGAGAGRRRRRKRWRSKDRPVGCFGRIFGAIAWVVAAFFEVLFSFFN